MSSISKQVLLIQGGGSSEDYETDKKPVVSLQNNLEKEYTIHYPRLPNESVPDLGRMKQIDQEIALINGDLILVRYSLRASMLLKYFSENKSRKRLLLFFYFQRRSGAVMKTGKRGLSCGKILRIRFPGTFRFFLSLPRRRGSAVFTSCHV